MPRGRVWRPPNQLCTPCSIWKAQAVGMMMPRLWSKYLAERSAAPASSVLPVDRATSKGLYEESLQDRVDMSRPKKIKEELAAAPTLLCGHPDLLPKGTALEPWCLPVLRTEAFLRLGEDYITATAAFYDSGQMPPGHLDEEVEAEALRRHGLSRADAASYRRAACSLDRELRSDIFFLKANDRLFRPGVPVESRRPEGVVYQLDGSSVRLEDMLKGPRSLLIASTSS